MVTVQTEHLDNHTARLTVDLPAERIEKALRQSARQIAQKARIPGFRPGKAPFNVIVSMFGFDYVLGDALERIGNDVYQEALEVSEVRPYTPGRLESVEEQGHKLVFIVPKVPEVDLGDYRALRMEFEPVQVTDQMVEDAMEELLEREAVIEDVDRPARIGDQALFGHFYVGVLLNEEEIAERDAMFEESAADDSDDDDGSDDDGINDDSDDDGIEEIADSEEVVDDDLDAGDDDLDGDEDENGEDDEDNDPERELFHRHDFTRVLREDDKDLFPGFSAEFVGAQAGDELEFYLDLPEDYEEEELAGRRLRIEAAIQQVQSRHVPEWSDELAQRIAQDDEEIQTILELRINVRKQLEEYAESQVDNIIAEQALDELVKGGTFHYPEELVQHHLDDLIEDMQRNMLAPQGLNLERYLEMTAQTEEQFREQFRENATLRAERSLALGELVVQEQLDSTDADIDAAIDKLVARFGGTPDSPQFRSIFDTALSRLNIGSRIVTDRAIERLVAIVKGEEPPVGVVREEEEEQDESESETPAEAADAAEVADAAEAADAAETAEVESAGDDPDQNDAGEEDND